MKTSILVGNMRTLRKKANYRQEDVSRLLNIQRQTYSNYENASRTPPLEIIIALAEIYNVSVDYLVCGIDHVSDRNASFLTQEERQLLNEFSALSEQKRQEVLEFIQFKKQLP